MAIDIIINVFFLVDFLSKETPKRGPPGHTAVVKLLSENQPDTALATYRCPPALFEHKVPIIHWFINLSYVYCIFSNSMAALGV